MFGRHAKLGLSDSFLSLEILKHLHSEEDVLDAVNSDAGNCSEKEDGIFQNESANEETEESLATQQINIRKSQKRAYEGLEKQAKKMKYASDLRFAAIDIGGNVVVPVPEVDRSKSDHRNLIGYCSYYFIY